MLTAATLFAAAALLFQTPPATDTKPVTPHIVMDGVFDDWAGIAPALVDPMDAPESAVDFGEVRITHDDRVVNLLIDFGRTVNAQGLNGTGYLLLDVDGNVKTGKEQYGMNGVDLIIVLTPPNTKEPSKPGAGIAVKSTTYEPDPNDPAAKKINLYDIGLIHAPTCAGRRMEFAIDRESTLPQTPELFQGDSFAGKAVFVDLHGAVTDETDVFTHSLGGRAKPQAPAEQKDDPLARAPSSDLRVTCWNVERGALFTRPEPFIRTLKAINPDVLLLEELSEKNSAEQLRSFLDQNVPGDDGARWNVVFGAGGGDLRCAVASRSKVEGSPHCTLIAFPDRPDRNVRAVGAIVEHRGKRLLATAVHLKCCGRADGPEDESRRRETHAIHEAIKAALADEKIDGVVIAGDFNLVGSREPLEALAIGLDLDRTALGVVDAYQIDGLSNATWADPAQPFVPGRLDYMLFADSCMNAPHSFVFDSRDLSPKWLELHGVQSADSSSASDHFPVVADFVWQNP